MPDAPTPPTNTEATPAATPSVATNAADSSRDSSADSPAALAQFYAVAHGASPRDIDGDGVDNKAMLLDGANGPIDGIPDGVAYAIPQTFHEPSTGKTLALAAYSLDTREPTPEEVGDAFVRYQGSSLSIRMPKLKWFRYGWPGLIVGLALGFGGHGLAGGSLPPTPAPPAATTTLVNDWLDPDSDEAGMLTDDMRSDLKRAVRSDAGGKP